MFFSRLRLSVCIMALLCINFSQATGAGISANRPSLVSVNNVRVWRGTEYTRLVLDLNAPVQYNLVLAENPTRILLDIPSTALDIRLENSLTSLALAGTPVDVIRASIANQKDLRLVFVLNKNVTPKSFFLKKQGGSDDRLVIDLYDDVGSALLEDATTVTKSDSTKDSPINVIQQTESAASSQVMAGSNFSSSKSNNAPEKEIEEPTTIEDLLAIKSAEIKTPEIKASEINVPVLKNSESKTSAVLGGRREIVITVDAGHGGQDVGALGPNGLREKDITLAIAKELVNAIKAQPGFTAHHTRTSDFFIPLQKRRNMARDMKADLFISIHADAFTNSSAKGASVFALSRRGATSEAARFLAQSENESDLFGGVGGVSLDDKDEVLAGVLVDLSMTATVNSSLQVGNSVLNSIGAMAPLHARHVEQAGFMVLKSPDVPSILIETGFISNKEEARQLASPAYRAQIAKAIFKGVQQYFAQNPPPDTHFAALQQGSNAAAMERQHTVVRGDTVAFIASRYNVSQNQLLKYNGLKNSTVKIGQTLKIPAS